MKPDYDILEFNDPTSWRAWLDTHHTNTDGVWIRIFKKASGIQTVAYAEALDDALCYGWIDGQRKSLDETSFVQKYTPRRKKSLWSKRNIEHVTRLIDANLMMPAGYAEIERAKLDGRWDEAYDSQTHMTIPDDFIVEVRKDKNTLDFFETLNKSDLFTIGFKLQTAKKPETRARRYAVLIDKLRQGQKP